MDLKNNLVRLTAYGLLDTLFTRLFSALSFIVLVHLLSKEDIGVIGVVSGYMALFGFLSISPETIILRDYPKIRNELSRHLSAFMFFWLIRFIILSVFALVVAVFLFDKYNSLIPAVFFFGSVFVYNLNLFPGIITQVFYAGFKQKTVTWINILLNLLSLILLFFLLVEPGLLTYLLILVASALIGIFVWYYEIRKEFHFRFENKGDFFEIIKESIYGFTLWNHLNSSILNMIYQVDTLILSFFTALAAVGDYTIALGIANFFFIVPQVVQRTVFIGFSNINDKRDEEELISSSLKYSFMLGIAQLVFFFFFGTAIIEIFFTKQHVVEIYTYALLITCGVTILNFVRPLMSLINSKCVLRDVFFSVYLPSGILALIGYVFLTVYFGAVGTAAGNIFAYLVFALLLYVFMLEKYPLKFRFEILSAKEKEILKNMFK